MTDLAILTEVDGHMLLTASATTVHSMDDYPERELAAEYEKAAGNEALMHLTGRFVEAEQANVNGAFWSTADLDYGEKTPVHAPVNFLHRTRHIIGAFTDSKLVRPKLAPAEQAGQQRPFLAVNAVLWREFFPYEARMVEMASDKGSLFWSMECQSRTIRCETSQDGALQGCGKEYPFRQVMTPETAATVCDHLRQRTAQRHFVQPRFNAGAVIVPPVKPGWREAHASVTTMAEALAEQTFAEAASTRGYDDATLVDLMARIVEFGKSLTPA